MSVTRAIGIGMLLYASVLSAAVWWYPPFALKHGGHNFIPLLRGAPPIAIVGVGLAIDTRVSKLISSSIIAAAGIWIILRDIFFFESRYLVINGVIGLLLCVPAIITLCRIRVRTIA